MNTYESPYNQNAYYGIYVNEQTYISTVENFEPFGCGTASIFDNYNFIYTPTPGYLGYCSMDYGLTSFGKRDSHFNKIITKLYNPSSITGDPHFVGLDGEKFEFIGIPNTWFNIITSKNMQFNALFKSACENKTNFTALASIAVKINGHEFFVDNEGNSSTFDGLPMKVEGWKHAVQIGEKGQYGFIAHPWTHWWHIETPEFTLVLKRHMVDLASQKPGMVYYGKNCIGGYFNLEFKETKTNILHGILGQTFNHTHSALEKLNTIGLNGEAEGEIEGSYKDYIVSKPFGTDFKFNLYRD